MTTKQQEWETKVSKATCGKQWKLKLTKQDERALEIQESNKAKEVFYRNAVNLKTNQVQKELIEFFRPFIGKKVRTISGYGGWSKLVKKELELYLSDLWNSERYRVLCEYRSGSLWFEIDTTYQYDTIDYRGCEDHSTAYVKAEFYVGSWNESTGNLNKVYEDEKIKLRKTDWTVEELSATRKKIKEMKEELRDLESSVREFK
tara:strand:+ start:642 stop:1250 length:609 start_codon:yes stop_codon:yes gene_type:complete